MSDSPKPAPEEHAPAWARILDPTDEDPAARRALRAWLALQRLLAYAPARAKSLLSRGGGPEAALAAAFGLRAEDLLPAPAFEREVAALASAEIALVPLCAPGYPSRLAALPDPAPVLAVRGSPAALAAPLVAIVGARAPSEVGLELAHRLAHDLAEHGVGVVSGLARGIDAAAHRGALDARGTTVAVSGCGPDLVYPAEHRALADRIAARGAVASELPLGAPPAKHHFPLRNRLISGLALAVVVVEARARSGSLVTARHALDQGREVLAVPGSPLAPTSAGPNQLLRSGAWPVLDASDVFAAIGLGPASPPERAAARAREPAGPAAQHPIVTALLRDPATRDELCSRLGWSAPRVARELLPLELEGRVREDRDGRLRVTRSS
jgi:DNA processing protein